MNINRQDAVSAAAAQKAISTSDTSNVARKAAMQRLFVASFTLLFFELACIRWFGSMVIYLTFFTNIVLLACFLGMSVGCLAAHSRRNYSLHILPLTLAGAVLAWTTLMLHSQFQNLAIDVGKQQSPQQIFFFGTEYRAGDPSKIVIPIEVIAAIFFLLIAVTFVGLGQKLGQALDEIPDRLTAYSIDIAGSLCGILLFALASYLQTPPVVWFAVSVAAVLYLTQETWRGPRRVITVFTTVALLATTYVAALPRVGEANYWSPYYKINYIEREHGILTNNISHQAMVPVAERGPAYALPHLLQRDSGGAPFKDVLVIGAGSGNDVQGARLFGASHIDGVEIDPVIQRLGRLNHPDRPYDDPRVTIHQDDGRSFLKRTDKKYDIVIYALVDSVVLHSGYTSLRLESYLFTREAMQDIKARLKPGGVFAMYNYFRQGWVVARLSELSSEVFGSKPIVMSLPYRKQIKPEDNQRDTIITFVIAGNTEKIKQSFAKDESFWLNLTPRNNFALNGFGKKPPTSQPKASWLHIGPAVMETEWTGSGTSPLASLPTDNWPFLYLREAHIPDLNIRGILLIGLLSIGLLWVVAPWRNHTGELSQGRFRPNWQMFFLGAGFMLLETKSVVHMALLYGSTWNVNSIVFGAVLLMILAANLFVHIVKPKKLTFYYVLLIVSLLIGIIVPMNAFLALPGIAKVIASCAVTFAPIFFAGIIFATSFRDSRQPGVDFGCNVAGVILGGLCENFSLMIGFSNLLGIAILFYLHSVALRPRIVEVTRSSEATT